MREAARMNLPVAVHAESEEITKALSRRMFERGRHDIAAFLESRPVIAEVEAIQRAGVLARETGCKLHVVHISSGRGVAAALEARSLGADISIETCPHYLLFTEDDLLRIGALAKCTPPLRNRAESNALSDCARRGEVDMIASDHSPCPPDMKQSQSFFGIWGGIAGVQWTRATLIEKGLDLSAIAALTAAHGAKRFHIANKGTIEVGKQADLAVIDPGAVQTVHEDSLFQRHRTTPYMGLKLHGVTRHTIRRGEVIFSEGAITATTKGVFVRPGI
jgi:allantoinase